MPIRLSSHEYDLLQKLRSKRRKKHIEIPPEISPDNALDNSNPAGEEISLGERIAGHVAETVGSWRFIVIQSFLLCLWIAANVLGWVAKPWDPYPFILLNLALSFQAAYTAPIIMMAQNRQADIDRRRATQDYDVNLKAELEIELLHQKIDMLRETEMMELTKLVRELIEKKS